MKDVLIKTEDLCKSFIIGKTGNNVLKNINLEIYKGDFTIIMGSSGSGKSTLLYSLSTMDKPTSGKVFLAGEDITDINEKEASVIRNKKISFIFQNINLFTDMTLFENIEQSALLSKKDKNQCREETEEMLKKLELIGDKDKYPSEVSGGMCQRTAIGRALINKPDVIFGDEPTGALNSSMGQRVLDLLTEINNEGQSIVMVTHDVKAALRGNRILYLSDGRIQGELNLAKYEDDDVKLRKAKIKEFLDEKGW